MTGIAELFDELSYRRDDYQAALEQWSAWRRQAANDNKRFRSRAYYERRNKALREYRASRPDLRALAVERTRQWRIANRERFLANARKAEKRRRERAKADPAFGAKYRAQRNESRKRQAAKDPAAWREKTTKRRREWRARQ